MRAFEAAARLASFARAAGELHVTPAAVSHQVKQLEHWLGLALFTRTANGVTLTAAGRDYASRIRDAFDRLIVVSRSVREQKERSVVTIKSQYSVATLWLLPRVIALARAEPDIEVRLFVAADKPTAKVAADLTVFHLRPDLPGWEQHALLRGAFRLYATPALAARLTHASPREILKEPLLHTTFDDREWRYPTMEDWFRAAGETQQGLIPGLQFNLMHMTAAACVAGGGIALLLDELCAAHVANGALAALPGPALPSPHPYFLMSPKKISEAVRRVRDALLRDAQPVST
jgi:LysR family transcriptional regulator, glycine cleavage system transcriptional activator